MLTTGQKAVLRVLSVILAATWIVLGVFNSWPVWVWVLLAGLSVAAPLLIVFVATERMLRRHKNSVPEWEPSDIAPPPVPAEPPPPQEYEVRDVRLPSARPDYHFVFSCTVLWRPRVAISHANPGAIAANIVLKQATSIAASIRPDDASRAHHLLTSALGATNADSSGYVEAWADRISLTLPDKDAGRLKQLADVRKDEEVWESVRSYERNVRAYLGEDVLTSPGSAVVWWLSGPRTDEKDRVDDAVSKIENLRKLTAAAAATQVPDLAFFTSAGENGFHRDSWAEAGLAPDDFSAARPDQPQLPFVVSGQASGPADDLSGNGTPQTWTDHVVAVVEDLPAGPEREFFAHRLADLLQAHGRHDAADDVRRRYDTPPGGAGLRDQEVDLKDSSQDAEQRTAAPAQEDPASNDDAPRWDGSLRDQTSPLGDTHTPEATVAGSQDGLRPDDHAKREDTDLPE